MQKLLGLTGIRLRFSDVDGGSVEVLCSQSRLLEATEALAGLVRGDKSEVLVVKLEKHFVEGRGLGRRVDLDNEITLRQVGSFVRIMMRFFIAFLHGRPSKSPRSTAASRRPGWSWPRGRTWVSSRTEIFSSDAR